jgi:hypothetical protein
MMCELGVGVLGFVIRLSFNGHSMVIQLSFDGHSIVMQLSFNCC